MKGSRIVKLAGLFLLGALLSGCTSHRIDHQMQQAYTYYDNDDCPNALRSLSQIDRLIRSKRYLQPEVSLLRGLCLERQGFYMDAIETYRYIEARYPHTEYGYRARARLRLLSGQIPAAGSVRRLSK